MFYSPAPTITAQKRTNRVNYSCYGAHNNTMGDPGSGDAIEMDQVACRKLGTQPKQTMILSDTPNHRYLLLMLMSQ